MTHFMKPNFSRCTNCMGNLVTLSHPLDPKRRNMCMKCANKEILEVSLPKKIKMAIELFDEIKNLLPADCSVNMTIHNIKKSDMPSGWDYEVCEGDDGATFITAKRKNDDVFNLTFLIESGGKND